MVSHREREDRWQLDTNSLVLPVPTTGEEAMGRWPSTCLSFFLRWWFCSVFVYCSSIIFGYILKYIFG